MTNAFVNAKFEQKRLELNKSKCHQIHIGTENKRCPELKSHEDIMVKSHEDKYVGDIISDDGKILSDNITLPFGYRTMRHCRFMRKFTKCEVTQNAAINADASVAGGN